MLALTAIAVLLQPEASPISVGWHDEMNDARRWTPIQAETKLSISEPTPGLISLNLGPVPAQWPYQFQWHGANQEATVDAARYPVLMARITSVEGYAHLDVDALDDHGKTIAGLRSTTVTKPGIVRLNVADSLAPRVHRLRVRLIVGGPNTSCRANYTWVRFVRAEDEAFLTNHPDFQEVRLDAVKK